MAVQVQKKKILYLMQILLERTDENHVMSAQDLCKALEEYGISSERKSIYNDVDALRDYGMDIVQVKGANQGYYIGSRDFELPELKLLVDAVQASKFITSKKSDELIKKLEKLTSKYEAAQLQRQVFIYNRLKTENETIYYNVDYIHTAIYTDAQIRFQYTEWTLQKELQLKKDGEGYVVSPWALTWADENYYLIAYSEKEKGIRYYRVDKMKNMELLKEKRNGRDIFENFDLALFSKKTFGMYGGNDEMVTLLCHNSLVGVVLDRFGQDVMMIPKGEAYFKAKVMVSVSRQFFGWVTGIGDAIEIKGPESVKREYKEYLMEILRKY